MGRGVLSRASARYWTRASARTRDLGMLTGRTRLENFFSSPSFSYTVRGLARLNISPASALHTVKWIGILLGKDY
jgi:hypothetical protein